MRPLDRYVLSLLFVAVVFLSPTLLLGKVTGSISGTVKDAQGAVVPGATVSARNAQTGVVEKLETDSVGFYNFPALPIGTYDLSVEKSGFKLYQVTGLIIDVDTALRADAVLVVGAAVQEITVQAATAQVNTETTQTGEVVESTEMTNMPLNGRSYTDLLALQPGVIPIGVQMFGTLSPANSLNDGTLSMSGQRDVNNGFMVNGANTVEGDMGGTVVIPNLDSIAEFRIITSNAGAEYGNYSGGQVNVATKSGTNQFHGDVFEFLRNSDMDSRNFYTATRGVLHQNMFGGTFGGPILKNKLFFFVDYQGERQVVGVDQGPILVPSAADKQGDFSDQASVIASANATGVNGTYMASLLSSRLGYAVTSGEPYFGASCMTTSQCVFPNYVVPQKAWDPVAAATLKLIPNPNVPNTSYFQTSAYPATLQDDKSGTRIDANTRIGMISGYWHYDPWSNPEPYSSYGGSTVPGFPNLTVGKAQLFTFSISTPLGGSMVNQFTASYVHNTNIQGLSSGTGPTLASLGFLPPSEGGMYQESGTAYQNWPSIGFLHYTLGQFNSVIAQYDQVSQLQDDFSKIVGTHSIKFGGNFHADQFWVGHPNNGSNGGFSFNGSETGSDLADMLVGATSSFYQGAPSALALRSYYVGVYAEDSWRVRPNLTFNYGLRWETTPYWSDSHNRNPDLTLGVQSTIFPTAPAGYDFPGDPGIPKHFANPRYDDFGPRIGLAYSPNFSSGFLHTVFGDSGKSSIRAGYGLFYTNIEGAATFNFAAPPFGLFYCCGTYSLYSAPYIDRQTGVNQGQKFPIPPVQRGATNINWSQFEPFGGDVSPLRNSPSPYAEHVDFSIQRQLQANTLLTVSYVGTFGHHLILDSQNNPANPQLCMSLSTAAAVLPGTSTCGPFGETGVFYPVNGPASGITVRGPFNSINTTTGQAIFGDNGYYLDEGNSDYHALQISLRKTAGRGQLLLAYTYSKAMDTGSGFGDQVPLNGNIHQYEALSVFDMPNNFSASYTVELPFDKLFHSNNRGIRGWRISGITTFTNGTPVQIYEYDDRSLTGSTSNSPQFGSLDQPNRAPGPIYVNRNPRKQYINSNGALVNPYFNYNLFSFEQLGTIGNSSRRFFLGPGLNNWTLALLKDVSLTESMRLEFRGEFFNVFNHTQFVNGVDGGATDGSTFGGAFSVQAPRIGQVAVKFIF
jgi:hypothetical protein